MPWIANSLFLFLFKDSLVNAIQERSTRSTSGERRAASGERAPNPTRSACVCVCLGGGGGRGMGGSTLPYVAIREVLLDRVWIFTSLP